MTNAKFKIPRGIRNNNPLNIRHGSHWQGLADVQSDRSFCQFKSIMYGIRAGFVLLRNYISGFNGQSKKFNTIELIIRRWAPPLENATDRYISFVSNKVGVRSSQEVVFSDKKTMCDIVAAMIYVECGMPVDRQVIESAYDLV